MQAGYVNIDERDYADWIVFAGEFARYVNYYDVSDTVKSNWKPFFENDISAAIGIVAVQHIDEYRLSVSEGFAVLKGDETASTITLKRDTIGGLFGCIMTLCKALDLIEARLPDNVGLKMTIRNLISSKLQPSLHKLLSWYKGGKALLLVHEKDYPEWKVLGQPVLKTGIRIVEGLSDKWIRNAANWADFYAGIPADESIYGNAGLNNHRKINHAANHNLFSGLFDQFLGSYARIIAEAETSLAQTLSTWNDHLPHYALFLSFLKLFRTTRDQINTLTWQHLDFYYRDVLQLFPRKAKPNQAHIIAELSKQADNWLLKKGSLVKAGKDSHGKEVNYAMDRDVVFNKAKVARLMAVCKGTDLDNFNLVNNKGRLFASPVANSANGLGKEPETAFKEWHPFISKKYTDGLLSAITMPKAVIGFALSSGHLCLTEGERLVNIRFAAPFSPAQQSALAHAACYLTSEKGWYPVSGFSWGSGTITGTVTAASVLTFSIPGDAPAITNYDANIHGGHLGTSLPTLKFLLTNEDTALYDYESLKYINITKIEVEVKVGLDAADNMIDGGVKNLLLSNDTGVLDPSKPFLPFGVAPKRGSSFIIGSDEIFKKKKTKLYFRIEWKDLPEKASDIDFNAGSFTGSFPFSLYVDPNPKVTLLALQSGNWVPVSTDIGILSDAVSFGLFEFGNQEILTFPDSMLNLPEAMIPDYEHPYKPFDITAIKGFLKLKLQESFGHQEYQKAFTEYLIALAKGESPGVPVEPYTPTIQKLSLHYKSSAVLDVANAGSYGNRDIQFFHICPFGETEQHKQLTGSDVKLFPQFVHPTNSNIHNAAEFYIGFENLLPGQSVNVLFQVLEGTTDPRFEKPKDHIMWSYLSHDQWMAFTEQEVIDRTSQMTSSGIITFVVPASASTDNNLLPAGYIWVRASVTKLPETVCKLIAVLAQAAVVTFNDQDNAPDFPDKPLPAGTISKLREATASIRKIEQPFSSFGGRANETGDAYYVRVSERLRHKARAITIWDYEHLLLEAFPEIHQVKCLNHTRYEGNEYNEVAPGHVTVITVPNLVNRNDANPLRPYTNQNILNAMVDFLKAKLSCHVTLHVRNPQFEEVRLSFKLKLVNGLEFNFYHDLLQQEITAFLTPWAYGKATTAEFGGKVHKSVLINFIEEQSYVDYITDVSMYHRTDENAATEGPDTDLIEASTAKSILVSAPAKKHVITEIVESPSIGLADNCPDKFNRTRS